MLVFSFQFSVGRVWGSCPLTPDPSPPFRGRGEQLRCSRLLMCGNSLYAPARSLYAPDWLTG